MADHLQNGLIASIKALDDVVKASVDAANPLAREQLGLVVRYLGFVRDRLALVAERDQAELVHYVRLAQRLQPHAAEVMPEGRAFLDEAVDAGARALSSHAAATETVRAAIDRLTTAISVLVRAAADASATVRRSIEREVTVAAGRLFDIQRAWYLPMGFEPDPGQVPPLSEALAAARGPADDFTPPQTRLPKETS